MKSELKRKIYDKVRKDALKSEFKKYGKVEETDDLIICRVGQRNIDKILKAYGPSTWVRRFNFNGKPVTDEQQKLYDVFKFNKPIVYVFDGITFNFKPEIYTVAAGVVFKNCCFKCGLEIKGYSLIKFINNEYRPLKCMQALNSIYCEGAYVFFENELHDELFSSDSNGVDNDTYDPLRFVYINADDLRIKNSNFNTEQFHVNAKNINISNSNIESSIDVIVNNENRNIGVVEYINSPIIFYNDKLVSRDNLGKTINNVQEIKKTLIDALEDIRNFHFDKREEKIEKISNKLGTLGKIKKKS